MSAVDGKGTYSNANQLSHSIPLSKDNKPVRSVTWCLQVWG